jgi:hypothetical protein
MRYMETAKPISNFTKRRKKESRKLTFNERTATNHTTVDFEEDSENSLSLSNPSEATLPTAISTRSSLPSFFIPPALLSQHIKGSLIQSMLSEIIRLENFTAANEEMERNASKSNLKLVRAFLHFGRSTPHEMHMLLANLSCLRKTKLSLTQLSFPGKESSQKQLWEWSLIQPPTSLDLVTVQTLRAMISTDVYPLSGLLTFPPRSIFNLGRSIYFQLASSPLEKLYEQTFKGTVWIEGGKSWAVSKRGWSEGRIYVGKKKSASDLLKEDGKDEFVKRSTQFLMTHSQMSFNQSSVNFKEYLGSDIRLGAELFTKALKVPGIDFLQGAPSPASAASNANVSIIYPTVGKTFSQFQNVVTNAKQLLGSSQKKDKKKFSRPSFMMTGFLAHTHTMMDKGAIKLLRRTQSQTFTIKRTIEKARIESLSRMMANPQSFEELQHILTKTIKSISLKLANPSVDASFQHVQMLPRFRVYDKSSPFRDALPWLEKRPKKKGEDEDLEVDKNGNHLGRVVKGVLVSNSLVSPRSPQNTLNKSYTEGPSMKKKNTDKGHVSFTNQNAPIKGRMETINIARDAIESKDSNKREAKIDHALQFNDFDKTSALGSDSKGFSEKRDAKIVRSHLNRANFLRKQSIQWSLVLLISFLVHLVARLILDEENDNIMKLSLEDNQKVVLLSEILNPITSIYKEALKVHATIQTGGSVYKILNETNGTIMYTARTRLNKAAIISNYTQVTIPFSFEINNSRLLSNL